MNDYSIGYKGQPVSMIERMASVLRRTWQYVGSEFEELCGGSCTKAEALEAVMDADRYSMDGDKEAVAEIRRRLDKYHWNFKPKEMKEFVDLAFPPAIWGR